MLASAYGTSSSARSPLRFPPTKRPNSIITSRSSTSCGWPRPVPTSFWLMASHVSERLRRQVAERAYHVCEYCLIHEDDTFWGRSGAPHGSQHFGARGIARRLIG